MKDIVVKEMLRFTGYFLEEEHPSFFDTLDYCPLPEIQDKDRDIIARALEEAKRIPTFIDRVSSHSCVVC